MAGRNRIRTDLALEATERFKEENVEVHGVEVREKYDKEKDVRTTVVRITTDNGREDRYRKRGEVHGASARKLYYNRSPGAFYAG